MVTFLTNLSLPQLTCFPLGGHDSSTSADSKIQTHPFGGFFIFVWIFTTAFHIQPPAWMPCQWAWGGRGDQLLCSLCTQYHSPLHHRTRPARPSDWGCEVESVRREGKGIPGPLFLHWRLFQGPEAQPSKQARPCIIGLKSYCLHRLFNLPFWSGVVFTASFLPLIIEKNTKNTASA